MLKRCSRARATKWNYQHLLLLKCTRPGWIKQWHCYRLPTKLQEGNVFASVCHSVHREGMGISGTMSFPGREYLWSHFLSRGRWVSLVPGPLGRWVCPGVGGRYSSPHYMGPGILWDRVDKQTVSMLLECFIVTLHFPGADSSQMYSPGWIKQWYCFLQIFLEVWSRLFSYANMQDVLQSHINKLCAHRTKANSKAKANLL